MVKQDKNERVRNYAKNVKDLYMPGKGKRPAISQGQGLSDNEGNANSYAEERKAYLATESDQGAPKEIRPRLRSGAALGIGSRVGK